MADGELVGVETEEQRRVARGVGRERDEEPPLGIGVAALGLLQALPVLKAGQVLGLGRPEDPDGGGIGRRRDRVARIGDGFRERH